MTDTRKVETKDKSYTIKRWSFDEGVLVDSFIESHKNDLKAQQKYIVLLGVVEPKFTEETLGQADYEVIARLWYELRNYNRFDKDFLLLLKNSSSQVAPTDVTRTP